MWMMHAIIVSVIIIPQHVFEQIVTMVSNKDNSHALSREPLKFIEASPRRNN
jgi:hypothetical protein